MTPISATAIAGDEAESLIQMQITGNSQISLYFHIPFCTKKCPYCHFFVLPNDETSQQNLLDGLLKEWHLRLPQLSGKKITSIYFGGGTPSLFAPQRLNTLLNAIYRDSTVLPKAEITIEANPESITKEWLSLYKQAGINRLSIGIQTLDPELLHLLGRTHSVEQSLHAVDCCHQSGLTNMSIDLMYDLPGQTINSWQKTVDTAALLPITHLSLYNLTIEPHTLFFKQRHSLKPLQPKEDESTKMYEAACETFERANLKQYEISAFAKNGYQSKHNSGYWIGRPFLGFGPSAFSYWEGARFQNIPHLKKYCDQLNSDDFPISFSEKLEEHARIRELLAIQLRLIDGVDLALFKNQNGEIPHPVQKTIDKLKGIEMLEESSERLRLTKQGRLRYDSIAVELI